jgi:hypothetical protein
MDRDPRQGSGPDLGSRRKRGVRPADPAEQTLRVAHQLLGIEVPHGDELRAGEPEMAAVERQDRLPVQPGDALLGARQRMGVDGALVDHLVQTVVGQRGGVLIPPYDLGQPLAAETLDFLVGESGIEEHLLEQVEAGRVMPGQQTGGDVAHVPVRPGAQIAAHPLGGGGDLHGRPVARALVHQGGGQGGEPRFARRIELPARGGDHLEAHQGDPGEPRRQHLQPARQPRPQEGREAEGVDLPRRRRDPAVDRGTAHQLTSRGTTVTTTRSVSPHHLAA